MKESYETPCLVLLRFNVKDVITTSDPIDPGATVDPWPGVDIDVEM